MRITIDIPDEKLVRVYKALESANPMPQEFNEERKTFENKYSEKDWLKRCIKKWLVDSVRNYETRTARQRIRIEEDQTIADVS